MRQIRTAQNRAIHSNEQIGFDYAKRFRSQVGLVGILHFANGDFRGRELHPGKNESGADQSSGDCTEGIKCLGEIQPPFGSVGIPS